MKYPKNEIPWVSYKNKAGQVVCLITSNLKRDMYYLYEVAENGDLKKIGRAHQPPDLVEKYQVFNRMN